MNANTLQLKRLHYGFRKEGVEEVKSAADVDTTDDIIQAIVWDNSGSFPVVVAIEELDVKNMSQTGRSTPMDKAVQKLKDRARRLHGVTNVKVPVTYLYGGNIRR